MSTITAERVIDMAQIRHPLLPNALTPMGAILKAVDARQRSLLVRYSGAIEGLANTTVQLNLRFGGMLVGKTDEGIPVTGGDGGDGWLHHETDTGVPYVNFSEPHFAFSQGITYPDGWAVHTTDAENVPYVDFSEIPIAKDPFGTSGGVPGFPLPADFLKLTLASAVFSNGIEQRIIVIAEKVRHEPQRTTLNAFITGNRLVPLRFPPYTNDAWAGDIDAISLSYTAFPELVTTSDTILLPAVLHEALIAGIAELLAYATPGITPGEKQGFSQAARMAEHDLGYHGADLLETTDHVVFKG